MNIIRRVCHLIYRYTTKRLMFFNDYTSQTPIPRLIVSLQLELIARLTHKHRVNVYPTVTHQQNL